jgi:hypothetical protein
VDRTHIERMFGLRTQNTLAAFTALYLLFMLRLHQTNNMTGLLGHFNAVGETADLADIAVFFIISAKSA